MSYKVSKAKGRNPGDRETVVAKTMSSTQKHPSAWWKAPSKAQRGLELVSTASFLKEQLQYRYRQAAVYSRMYSNIPLYGAVGSNFARMSQMTNLPIDRPTMNVVQSCVDTLVSRITQGRPRPIFLTDNADYKQRNLAKQLNQFIAGEFHQTKAYQLGEILLRDASVLGTGCVKVYKNTDNKVALERVLLTELLVDPNDSMYGDPRQMYQLKLVDRQVLIATFPDFKSVIESAEQAYPDNASDSSKTVSDQVMVVEGWHLPSAKGAGDGRHTISCNSGTVLDEEYTKDSFPFVFLHYSPRILGFFGQALVEQIMGTQMEINKLLVTISQSINLVGVPRIFVESGSKVVKAHLNNQIGSIVTYQGTKPEYSVAPCVPQELYAQLQRLVDYAYQQSGISSLAAASKKPEGLDSGAAIREYDDLQSDRFAALNRRYDNMFIDLAYQIMSCAADIAEKTGSYQTIYPNKDGTREINLPKAVLLTEDPFVIQCYDASSLPRDPAGRLQKVTEMIQAGMISVQEGRRLLDYPDLEQNEKLANSGEERILKILDEIVDTGKYTPPDPFMDPSLAAQLATQYYNLYVAANLSEDKAQKIRTFFVQAKALGAAAQAAMAPQAPQPQLATPEPVPTSSLLPQGQ